MDRIEVKFASDAVDAKTGEFAGYGAIFGNIDSHGDVLQPGAFRDSLAEWGAKGALPAMKLMHGTALNPFSGSDAPIGVWTTMREDQKGLRVEGKISGINTEQGRYYYELMSDGALSGLSIGFTTLKASKGMMPQVKRQLEAVKLFEVSLVGSPSNDRSLVDSIKSIADFKTIREFEDALVSGTLPAMAAKDAKALLAAGFKAIRTERDAGEVSDELAEMIRRNITTLTPKG